MIIANVNQNHSSIAKLSRQIREELSLIDIVNDDINIGTKRLVELNSASDAIQITSDNLKDTRHFANTLFNIMRGGIFDNNYQIEKWDFKNYLEQANTKVAFTHEEII